MKNIPEDMQKKVDLANSAIEDKNAPPSGLEIINDREKLEDRATYNANQFPLSVMGGPEAMQDYKDCKKTNLGDGIVIATGTVGVASQMQDAFGWVPGVAGPAAILEETAKAFSKTLDHVSDHRWDCTVNQTLNQPDPIR
jgi:hypothetical protein